MAHPDSPNGDDTTSNDPDDDDDDDTSHDLTDDDYERIRSFDNVYILPFASQKSDAGQVCFGLGLSRLMIRNLMLLRNVSIHGPEDTSEVTCEAIHEMTESRPQSCHVTGVANHGADGYSLQVEAHRPGRPVSSA